MLCLGWTDCALPFKAMNSQPCWWEIPFLGEGITVWGKIIPQSPLTSSQTIWPVPSAAHNTRLSSYTHPLPLPCLKVHPKRDHGRELSFSPSSACSRNTSTRFVASLGDFSLLYAVPLQWGTLCLLCALLILALSKPSPSTLPYWDWWAVHGQHSVMTVGMRLSCRSTCST